VSKKKGKWKPSKAPKDEWEENLYHAKRRLANVVARGTTAPPMTVIVKEGSAMLCAIALDAAEETVGPCRECKDRMFLRDGLCVECWLELSGVFPVASKYAAKIPAHPKMGFSPAQWVDELEYTETDQDDGEPGM
jgi:hypothetical protein